MGVVESITTHDLCRGAARDITYLPVGTLVVTSKKVTASAIEHSRQATDFDVTEEYVGRDREEAEAVSQDLPFLYLLCLMMRRIERH